jgi:threonine aldolase
VTKSERDAQKAAARAACTRFLSHFDPRERSPRAVLTELAAAAPPELEADTYGSGEVLEGFEQRVAELLGKEAAVFMPSGTMAQQIAMRIWADRRGIRTIAFHPTCHLEIHEQKGYSFLHGLHAVHVGAATRLITRADLEATPDPLAALLIELPQREIGGQLPTWEELSDISAWARGRGVPLHLDGARLWESGPFYERSYAEIASLFDSVYVSFYKGLGGLAGAVLAGERSFVAEARRWQRRHGGNLVHLYPYVLSAKLALETRLDRMPAYHRKVVEIAAHLAKVPGVTVCPSPPHTNMIHVYLPGDRERLEDAALALAREKQVWLFSGLRPTVLPDQSYTELVASDCTLAFSGEEVAALFREVLERAGG